MLVWCFPVYRRNFRIFLISFDSFDPPSESRHPRPAMKGSVVQEARPTRTRSALGHRAVGPGLGVERSGVDAHPSAPVTAFRDRQPGSSPLLPACEPLGLVDRRTAQSGPFINALTARARFRKETIRNRKQTLSFLGGEAAAATPSPGRTPALSCTRAVGRSGAGPFCGQGAACCCHVPRSRGGPLGGVQVRLSPPACARTETSWATPRRPHLVFSF